MASDSRRRRAGSAPSTHTYWLEVGGRNVAVNRTLVLGRSPACAVVLDDSLVSRQHARLAVTPTGPVIEDLGSANGVLINGVRIRRSTELENGDRIVLGQQELFFRAVSKVKTATRESRRTAPSRPYRREAGTLADVRRGEFDDATLDGDAEPTGSRNVFDVLGAAAYEALASGDVQHAARMLGPALDVLRSEVSATRRIDPTVEKKVTRSCLELAAATRHGRWIDQLVAIYTELMQPMPTEIVDRLYDLVRQVDRIDARAFSAYLECLRPRASRFPPAQRFAHKRLEGLERIVRLR